jgi:hypothetical protein
VRRLPSQNSSEAPITFGQWKATQNLPLGQLNELIKAVGDDDGYWFFVDHKMADKLVHQVTRDVGGYQFKIPSLVNDKDTLMYYLRFYDKTNHALLNARGHELIANITMDIVKAHVPSNIDQFVEESMLGQWVNGDSCHLWLTTGACPFPHSPGLVMTQYDSNAGKCALEVQNPGWIDVTNPFDKPRPMYVSFMAKNSAEFPEVSLTFNDGTQILNPIAVNDTHKKGVTRTIPAGMMLPGTSRVIVTPLNNRPSTSPFSLLGITFTNLDAVPFEYDFGPVYNN